MSTTFSSKFACNLIEYVRSQGHEVAELYQLLGLSSQYLNREDIRIPSTKMSQIWHRAMEMTDDEDVGLHMGLSFVATALRTTSMIMQSSATVYEALEQGVKYSALIADVMACEMGEEGGNLYLEFTHKNEWLLEPAPVIKDCLNLTLASAFFSVRQITGQEIVPAFLRVAYPKPQNAIEYNKIFNCDIEFDAPGNQIGFPRHLSASQVITRDEGLLVFLEKYADELKASFIHTDGVAAKTQSLILEMMSPQPPTVDLVAERLNMSVRSLQRKLKSESNATYKDLVDDVRKKLCTKLMDDPNRSVDELGHLTGYSDTASFIRAFKRWYGKTPGQMNR